MLNGSSSRVSNTHRANPTQEAQTEVKTNSATGIAPQPSSSSIDPALSSLRRSPPQPPSDVSKSRPPRGLIRQSDQRAHVTSGGEVRAQFASLQHKGKVPVQTNVGNEEELKKTFEEFKANGKKTAIVSGGSLGGMAAAMQLKKLGFNVLVAEKRDFYSRHNVLGKREEAMYSLASLSEDGALLRHLIDNKYISINKSNVAQEPNGFKGSGNPGSRFMGWMAPHEKMAPIIPDRSHKYAKEQAPHLALERPTPMKGKEPLEHIDLAWPEHEVVIPVQPKDWSYRDLTRMGPDNLATAKVQQLEKGLNEYCIAQGIKFVRCETSVSEQPEDGRYLPTLSMDDAAGKSHVTPDFPIDLICLAESASSKNAKVISLQTTLPTNESVYITNFSGKASDSVAGFTGRVFDADDTTIVLHASTKDETVVNIGTRGKPKEDVSAQTQQKKLEKAKPIMTAAKSDIKITPKEITYKSGRLDIALSRAMNPIHGNMIIIGDGMVAGSPIGALGGSLALSAYPEMVKRLVTDPRFGSAKAQERDALADEIRVGLAQIGNVRHGLMDNLMRQLGFYSETTQKQQLLQGASSLLLLHDKNRKGLVMDPGQPERVWLEHPAGEAWLRDEFSRLEANADNEVTKPLRKVLEYMISGNYPPIKDRTPSEVYWEHLLLRHAGDQKRDLQRNYAPDVEISFVGSAAQTLNDSEIDGESLKGHDGVKTANQILSRLMPTTKDVVADTAVYQNGDTGWMIEQWNYTNTAQSKHVRDGIDALQIKDGQIRNRVIGFALEQEDGQAGSAGNISTVGLMSVKMQKQETRDALARFSAKAQEISAGKRTDASSPSRLSRAAKRTLPKIVPVHVREEEPEGEDIIVTLREGHWVEKPKPGQSRVQVGLHTGKTVTKFIEDVHERAGLLDRVEIDGQVLHRTDGDGPQALVLANWVRSVEKTKKPATAEHTDPRTPEGEAWLRNEWAKVCARITDPAAKPRKEVIDWIVSGKFPPKTSRKCQDTYWEHIFLRYCGGDFLPLDLERNYSEDLRWAYIGEWNASGKGHPAIHTSATLLNDKLASTGYDVYDTKFMTVGNRLCVTELWGYRDAEIKKNQVTDGVDTFWIQNGEITHKMISMTVTDADGNERDYYKKIGQPVPSDLDVKPDID